MARVRLYSPGVVEVLRSQPVAAVVRAAAEEIGAAARAKEHTVTSGEPLPIDVFDDPGTDRAGVTVAIRHPAGVGMEAHHGLLKNAAHAAGYEPEGLKT
ncbi:hypothetical protein [Saccharopolyspora hattusasensis]|uniref:hypothetical protein n=1 Tax=Saccharopolyspora hattusasensis TaxID=1128679 RepID=UPI003D95C08E